MDKNSLLTTEEITEMLNIHRDTLYKWRSKGMPYRKLGRLVRYDLEKVLSWLEEEGKEKQRG